MRKQIVILGAGFGGVYTCKYLLNKLKNKNIDIILVNKSNYFTFTPMLHEVATGGLDSHSSIEPIREIFKANNFKFLRDEVKEINFNEKKVILKSKFINYDYLVIAIGAKTNFYNIKGAEKNSITLKSLDDAAKIRKKIITSVEESVKAEDKNKIKELLTFVIAGAGPTGVELAAEIHEFIDQNLKNNYKIDRNLINIILIQKGPKIMHQLDDSCIKLTQYRLEKKNIQILLNSTVTEVSEDFILINNKDKIITSTIIWTAGIIPNFIKTIPKITDERNYFHINNYLQVKNL